MTFTKTDLRSLARAPLAGGGEAAGPGRVPRPGSRWRTRVLIPLAVVGATGAILAYAARDLFIPGIGVHVAAVVPKPLGSGDGAAASTMPVSGEGKSDRLGPLIVQAPGWIEPEPYAVSVPALAEGVVREVLVLEGERVEAGQVVARFVDDDARLQVRAAEASLGEREADVERAKAAVATAESQVRLEEASLEELRDEVERKRELVAIGGISSGEIRRLEIRHKGAEARVATAEGLVNEARASLRQAEAAIQGAAVVRDEAQLRLARMEVRSSVAGVVLARLIEPGSRISMGSKGNEAAAGGSMSGAVLRLYDPGRLQVRVDVPLAEAAKVGVGTRAVVTTEALPDQVFSGAVSRLVHEANIQRNTVQFKVALDAPSAVLKPEMLTRVKLYAAAGAAGADGASGGGGEAGDSAAGTALFIPVAAVTPAGEGRGTVWVVDATSGMPVARRREVVTGASADAGYAHVIEGLRLTDRVVLDAPASLHDGARLKILGERGSVEVTNR